MIEVGQLRRWTIPDEKTGVFLIVENVGQFYPVGLSGHGVLEDYWDLIEDGELHTGWSSSLLEDISEAVNGAQ
jgi:hypothetical protein